MGREFEKALHYLSQAADQAKSVYAHTEAATLYHQALDQVYELLKKDRDAWKLRAAELHENRADVLALLGNQEEAQKNFQTALSFVESNDLVRIARLHRKRAKAMETQRMFVEAFEEYAEAERLLTVNLENQTSDWQQEWIQICLDRLWLSYTQNQLSEMQKDMALVEPLLERAGTTTQKLRFYQSQILAAYRRDRYRISDETLAVCEKSRRTAEEIGLPGEIASINFVSGFASLWRGNLNHAENFLKLGLSEASRLGDAVLQSRCLTYLTVLYRRRKDTEQARSYAERSLELSRSINMQEYVAAALANLGWIHWRKTEYDKAKELCAEAVRIWRSLPLVSPFQELALWPLIAINLKEGKPQEACDHAESILHASQRQLDSDLEQHLRKAIEMQSSEMLVLVTNSVEEDGYL
jgi:tetratricopeptide (TPR) repeat protein